MRIPSGRGPDWRTVRWVALDVETTGLDPGSDALLSFGVVPVDEGRVRLDRSLYRVVDPGRPIPADVVRVHGIRPADLKAAPPVEEAATELAAGLAGHPIVVWAAWVEAGFLASSLGGTARRWRRRLVDVRDLVAHLDRRQGLDVGAGQASLYSAAERFGVPLEDRHHALGDAFVTAQLFVVVVARLDGSRRLGADAVLRLGGAGVLGRR